MISKMMTGSGVSRVSRSRAACVLAFAVLVALMATGTSAQSQGGTARGPGVVKLGLITPLTGGASFYGERERQGVELAIDVINKRGGILGKQISLIVEDNQTNNAQTVSLVRKVASDQDIVAIVAPVQSGTFMAGAPIAESVGIVWASAGAGGAWGDGLPNEWTFRNTYPFSKMVDEFMRKIVAEMKPSSIAAIYSPDNEGMVSPQKVAAATLATLGIDARTVLTAPTGTRNFGPQITTLIQANPTAVHINLSTGDAALFMRQARERGLKSQFISAALGLVDLQVIKLSAGAAEGAIVPATFDPTSGVPSTVEFVQAWNAKHGVLSDFLSAYAYDMVFALAEAMKVAGTTTDRKAVRDAFGRIKNLCLAAGCYTWNGPGDATGGSIRLVRLSSAGFVSWP